MSEGAEVIAFDYAERGRRIAESGNTAGQGEFLGRIEAWGLDVYEGSPQGWKNALFTEWEAQDAAQQPK